MNMNKKILGQGLIRVGLISGIFFSLAVMGHARPPSAIELSYDKGTQSLHVVVKHLSDNMRKHYIRKVMVSKNDEKPVPQYFSSQTSATELVADILFPAVPTDTIHVEAVCSEAGRLQQSLVVAEQ